MQFKPPRWDFHPSLTPEQIRCVQSELAHLHLLPLTVQLLANRGITDPAEIEEFLQPPDVSNYPDPLLLTGMKPAVDRICRAIDGGEKVVVYGDYDADGVTSTALLTIALRHLGAMVEPYIPHRVNEGYGLNAGAVREIAARGAGLLITVDCGISGRSEVEEARRAGLDVIVTDHHHLPDSLPEAAACINPKQRVAGCEAYENLCGVGVAYQLVRALVKRCGKPPGLRNLDLLVLVAIGTVADVVPLRGANRSLVQQGLAALPYNRLPGLTKMLEYAGVKANGMDADRIGFIVGPRLNAAGRIDDANVAYSLLTTDDLWEAAQLAQKLEAQNRRRQAIQKLIIEQARERATRMDDGVKLILVHDPGWNSGVIGLVASRLVEEFGRPVIVIEEGAEESRGSARSTPHFNIVEALTEVQELLVRFGGHSAAAGFTVRTERIPELNQRLCCIAAERLHDDQLQPTLMADVVLQMADVNDGTLDAINRLTPFGAENPLPLFMARGVRVLDARAVGDGSHLKLMLADQTNISGMAVEAIAFGLGHLTEAVKRHPRVDLLFHIERREWRGDTHLQLRVRDIRLSQ